MLHCLACHSFSAGPFLIILVPLERGGSCGHFKSNYIEIGPRSSEISSIKHWHVEIFRHLLKNPTVIDYNGVLKGQAQTINNDFSIF